MVISSLCTGTRVSHPRLPQVRHLRTGSWLQSYDILAISRLLSPHYFLAAAQKCRFFACMSETIAIFAPHIDS